jgi:hypothetical protein
MAYGRWQREQHRPRACVLPVMTPLANERLRTTHRLLLAILCSLRRDDHLPILLLCRKDFCAQLELETLLSQGFLELFSE